MASIAKTPRPRSKHQPTSDNLVIWVVNHATQPLAPRNDTAKKYAEAERLLKEVIIRHSKTPWADLRRIFLTAVCQSDSMKRFTMRNITNARNLYPSIKLSCGARRWRAGTAGCQGCQLKYSFRGGVSGWREKRPEAPGR